MPMLMAASLAALDPRRQRVVDEAVSWIGTPYHPQGRVKGAGVDCLTFLACVYGAVGIIPADVEIPFYRNDVMLHTGEEIYLQGVLEHGHEVEVPLPGDVVLYRWGKIFGHAGIVTGAFTKPRGGGWQPDLMRPGWPWIIHATSDHGVFPINGTQGRLAGRHARFISPF
jgi:cell wall-associated NlpC family hydrolase